MGVEIKAIKLEKPEGLNTIIGQSHFIKTVEDVYEALVTSTPSVKFGLAFVEASGDCLVRFEGNDDELVKLARENAYSIGAGHLFIVFMRDAFPINVLNAVKNVQEVCTIFAASANPMEVIVGETSQGRAVLGVVDGFVPKGIEDEAHVEDRKNLLRKFGYKL